MTKVPIAEIRGVLGARKDAAEAGKLEVRACVMVCEGAPVALARALKEALRPNTPGARVHVEGFRAESGRQQVNALSDFAVVVAGGVEGAGACASLWRDYATIAVPACVVGSTPSLETGQAIRNALLAEGVSEDDCLVGLDTASVVDALGAWLVASLSDDTLQAAYAGFSCCRGAQARMLVREAAVRNALAALLGLLPGSSADRIVMTAEQARMAVRLAGLYKRPLDSRLVRDLVPVLAAAPAWRALSRTLSRRLPLPGLLVRAAVGAGGTLAVGTTLTRAFSAGQAGGEGSGRA